MLDGPSKRSSSQKRGFDILENSTMKPTNFYKAFEKNSNFIRRNEVLEGNSQTMCASMGLQKKTCNNFIL